MLVLARYPNERVIIEVPPSATATTIEVVLVRIGSFNQARLGFEAPENVNFCRSEIHGLLPVIDKIQRAASLDDCDCDVDTSVKSSPLKNVGSAIRDARLAAVPTGTDSKKKNADYED